MTALVLLHGITESKRSWEPLVQPLSIDPVTGQNRPLLNLDLRGHGEATRVAPFDLATMAVDAIGEIAAAGISPDEAVIIGHSLGGTVVTAMATAAPFRGVINVDQPLRLADFKEGLLQLEPMLRGDEASFAGAIGMLFDSMRGPLSDEEFARISALRSPEQDVVLDIWEPVLTMSTDDLTAMVDAMTPAIASPYLALHGIDPGPEYAAWIAGAIKGAVTEVWADHGHYPHLVDPGRFVDRVNAFVASVEG